MKKIGKGLCVVLTIILVCSGIPFSAAAITYGDANYDGEVDVRDIVRVKRHLQNQKIINASAIDYDYNDVIEESDLMQLRKVLLGEDFYSYFPETVKVNEIEINSNREYWNLENESSKVIRTTYEQGMPNTLYFAETGSDFVAEFTAKNITIGTTSHTTLYAGFEFNDGANRNWVAAYGTGYKYTGDDVYKSGLISGVNAAWVLNPTAQEELKFAVVKKGDNLYIYMNDELRDTAKWSTVAPQIDADSDMAIGIMMSASEKATLEVKDYDIEIGTDAAANYLNAKLEKAVFVNGQKLTSGRAQWDMSKESDKLLTVTEAAAGQSKTLYFTETGTDFVAEFTARNTSATTSSGNINLTAAFMFTDGSHYNWVGAYGAGYVHNNYTTGYETGLISGLGFESAWVLNNNTKEDVKFTLVKTDDKLYVYMQDVLISVADWATVAPEISSDSEIAVGMFLAVASGTYSLEVEDYSLQVGSEAVSQYMSENFQKTVYVNNTAVTSNTGNWDITKQLEKLITTTSKSKSIFFAETGTDFIAEFTATNTTTDTAAEAYIMAGFEFTDGTNYNWIGAYGTGYRYTGGNYVGSLVSVPGTYVLNKTTKAPLKFAVVKQGDTVYVYMNDVLVNTNKWATIAPNIASTSKVAVGINLGTATGNLSLEIKDYSFTTDTDAIEKKLSYQLDYGTGLDETTDNYNATLYGMNGNDVWGADPGCFYVSEEEDPVYGGYFYMYTTGFATNDGASLNDTYYANNNISNLSAMCYRSKDLYQWERCGALDGGYSCVIDEEDWCQDLFWAPEAIRNPDDGKYYLYFSAAAPKGWATGISNSDNAYDRLFLGVAVGDTPMGPFDVLYDTDEATGKRIPTINFQTGCSTDYAWSVIDASPFFDNGELYLYFNKHADDHYTDLNGIWGMKMKSMSQPDYETVSCLTIGDKVTASNTPGKITSVETGSTFSIYEGKINEGPNMIKHNNKYYLTYSRSGFTMNYYSVMQAVSNEPLSGFTKVSEADGNPVLDGSKYGFMNGTGHHALVSKGEELYIVYHRHDSAFGWSEGGARSVCADRVQFVENASGTEVLTANGPSKGLNWLSESISGYKNLAKDATIQVSSGTGAEYLNDEVLPFYQVTSGRMLTTNAAEVKVTLSWTQPVSVNSVMVYNSTELVTAFSNISDIRFKLAEQPTDATQEYVYATIKDLEFPSRYYENELETYILCAPAVAEFDTIKVTEMTITLKASEKVTTSDLQMALTEIVVLGGKDYETEYRKGYSSFCTYQSDEAIRIDGVLDETEWYGKSWFTNTYNNNLSGDMPTLKLTGFTTDAGIYIASIVDDEKIVNNSQRSIEKNSYWELMITADNVSEQRVSDRLYATKYIVDMREDSISYNPNFNRAVNVSGPINHEFSSREAVLEMFIPWEALGVDTSKGTPTEFRVYPAYRAMLETTATTTTPLLPMVDVSGQTRDYYRFGNIGYMTADAANAIIGDSKLGNAKTGNWDVSKEPSGEVNSSGGEEHHKIFFSEECGSNFIVETTIVPKKAINNANPKVGIFFQRVNGVSDTQWHSVLLDMRASCLGVGLNGTKNFKTYQLITINNVDGNWNENTLISQASTDYGSREGTKLTVIKYGENFWYFADGNFLYKESQASVSGEVLPGFYALGANATFKNYSCESITDETALNQHLAEYGVTQ